MSVLDKNKVFFGLIHYILSEQKNVDWIIKTSLIDFTGISSLLEEKPYKTDNILDEIIDYVKSIKPYHVQFSKYFEKYETATEQVDVHSNDHLEPTIIKRFDRIQSESDVIMDYYETIDDEINYLVSFEIIPNPIDSTVTIKTTNEPLFDSYDNPEYNKNGLLIFSTKDMRFYERKKIYFENYKKSIWGWVCADIELIEGLYYETKGDVYYIYEKDVYVDNMDDEINYTNNFINRYRCLTTEERKTILNYHCANRLYELGLHDNNEIRKELDANFKGVEINGSLFDFGKFGYDIFDYDTNDYDIPTIIYDYCIINRNILNNELDDIFPSLTTFNPFDEITIPYIKDFVEPEIHQFKLSNTIDLNLVDLNYDERLYIFKQYKNNEPQLLTDYSINNEYIDIFNPIGLHTSLIIIKAPIVDNIQDLDYSKSYCQYIKSFPYTETDSDTIKRKYIEKDILSIQYDNGELINGLEIPNGIDTSKLVIQLKSATLGNRLSIDSNNYMIIDNKLFMNDDMSMVLDYYDHIIITSFDYKYLYDKIYFWEDKYGRSNNIINLDGNKFLRALYEKGRPSELVVSQPNNDLFFYINTDNKCKIFRNDFKNNITHKTINTSYCPKIKGIEYSDVNNLIIKSITLSNTRGLKEAPNKVLINSEIIEYTHLDKSSNTISGLKRGVDGSFIYMNELNNHLPRSCSHKIDDLVIPYHGFKEIEKHNRYISYNITDNEQYTYTCPSGVKTNSGIYVSKLIKINLLEDINLKSSQILIDSPYVLNGYDKISSLINHPNGTVISGNFSLKINDDTIPFKTIYKIDNAKYCIENFTLPPKYNDYIDETIYKSKSSFILSSLPLELKNENNTYIFNDIRYLDESFVIEYQDGSLNLEIVESPNGKTYDNSSTREFNVKINETDIIYSIVGSYDQNSFNGLIYNVDGSTFGLIKNNIVFKQDNTIYAKIDGNRFITIDTVIKLESPILHKNESLKINVVDDEFVYNGDESDKNKLVTITFVTNPSDALLEINAGANIPNGNTITVPFGTEISYHVSKDGYYPIENTIIAELTEDINIELEEIIEIENVTLSFVTNPYNANIEISADGYVAFENTITVPVDTEIKYRATHPGYYDLEGYVIANKTEEILLTLSKEITVEDADYIVLRYIWTDGQDLDTETAITNATNIDAINNQFIGWKSSVSNGLGPSVPRDTTINNAIIMWSGDQQGTATEENPCEENILYNINNLLSEDYYNNLPTEISSKLSGTWYVSCGTKPVKLEIIGYKGGIMTLDNENLKFINEGGEQIEIIDSMGNKHLSISLYVNNLSTTLREYKDLAYITINKETHQFKISSIE